MSKKILRGSCDFCETMDRRLFLKSTAVAALLPFGAVRELGAEESSAGSAAASHHLKKGGSETLVSQFYKGLSEEQRKAVCFEFGHELQSKIDNNWFITKTRVKEFSKDQQAMIRQIVQNLHSEEYAKSVMDAIDRKSVV